MKLLAIDTTSDSGSIALIEDGAVGAETPLVSPDGYAHVLFDAVHELAGNCQSIDCFAAAQGPGSFTGVRVGLAAVKGLAEAAGKPAVAISNLQALASYGSAPYRAAVIDAHRREVYAAVFDTQLNVVSPEVVIPLQKWIASLEHLALEIVSADEHLFEGHTITVAPRMLAAAVGKLAWERFRRGEAVDPAALDANYVRRSDAEIFWKG